MTVEINKCIEHVHVIFRFLKSVDLSSYLLKWCISVWVPYLMKLDTSDGFLHFYLDHVHVTEALSQYHAYRGEVNVVLLYQATLIKIINTHSQQIISCNPFKEIPWKDMYLFKVIAKKKKTNLQRNYICTCTYFLKIVSFKNENSKDFFIQCEKI